MIGNSCRSLLTGLSLAAVSALYSPSLTSAQAPSACYDSASARARGLRSYYGVIVSNTDSASIAYRAEVGLPTLSKTQVNIVGDTAVCRTASQAYDATLEVPYPSEPVIVLELGIQRMVVKDIGFAGGVLLGILFNQDFTTMIERFWN